MGDAYPMRAAAQGCPETMSHRRLLLTLASISRRAGVAGRRKFGG